MESIHHFISVLDSKYVLIIQARNFPRYMINKSNFFTNIRGIIFLLVLNFIVMRCFNMKIDMLYLLIFGILPLPVYIKS